MIDDQPARSAADRIFIDAETFLPARMNTVRTDRGAPVLVEIYYNDWRDVDGLKIRSSSRTVSEAEYDAHRDGNKEQRSGRREDV